MRRYPLVYRNRVVLFYRGFMIVWLGTVVAATIAAAGGDAGADGTWWPWFMAAFWLVGLWGLAWSLNQETSEVRITAPRSIHIRRGPAFRRAEHWTDRARLWIEDTKDSDGDPYFRLWMDAPGGKLAVREGHRRGGLEQALAEIEGALEQR